MDVPRQPVLQNLPLSVSSGLDFILQADCLTTAIVRQDAFKKTLKGWNPFHVIGMTKSGRAEEEEEEEGDILWEKQKKCEWALKKSSVLCVPLALTDSTLICSAQYPFISLVFTM